MGGDAMKRYIASLAAALFFSTWLAGCAATAPPAMTAPDATTSTPPRAEVTWRLTAMHDFESRSPGLGNSQRYDSAVGWADVYRYGLGRRNWAMGIADAAFEAHFRATIDEVRMVAQTGGYTELRIGPTRDVRIGGLDFRTVSFQMRRQGRPHESRTFLTGLKGELLKYRLSFPLPVPGSIDDISRAFIEKHLRESTGAIDAAAPGAAGLQS